MRALIRRIKADKLLKGNEKSARSAIGRASLSAHPAVVGKNDPVLHTTTSPFAAVAFANRDPLWNEDTPHKGSVAEFRIPTEWLYKNKKRLLPSPHDMWSNREMYEEREVPIIGSIPDSFLVKTHTPILGSTKKAKRVISDFIMRLKGDEMLSGLNTMPKSMDDVLSELSQLEMLHSPRTDHVIQSYTPVNNASSVPTTPTAHRIPVKPTERMPAVSKHKAYVRPSAVVVSNPKGSVEAIHSPSLIRDALEITNGRRRYGSVIGASMTAAGLGGYGLYKALKKDER